MKLSDAVHTVANLLDEIDELTANCVRMQKALNDIASWSEGETVNSSFDEPHSAEIARKALENTK